MLFSCKSESLIADINKFNCEVFVCTRVCCSLLTHQTHILSFLNDKHLFSCSTKNLTKLINYFMKKWNVNAMLKSSQRPK